MLVVVHTAHLEVLLLERADHPGSWQSVTGSVEKGESFREAAMRELGEETGLKQGMLLDWEMETEYEIYPEWRHRYAPGVTRNTEHAFGFRIERPVPVTLSPREHLNCLWLPFREAALKVFSSSNASAILKLPEMPAKEQT